ncbi:MAG: hypothetical protein NT029_22375 [Armatimonadetes bacterium]|nr:hypothetical protein [Armatimonadota bacterium]
MPLYRAYGLALDYPDALQYPLPLAPSGPTITVRPAALRVPASDPCFVSPWGWQDVPSITVRRCPEGLHLRLYSCDYLLRADSIGYSDWPEPDPDLRATQMLGAVLSVWFEANGAAAIHASSVEVNGWAVLFLASQSGGKSTLAAGLTRCGLPLHADDVAVLQRTPTGIGVRPGFAAMRLWPASVERLGLDAGSMPLVHPRAEKRIASAKQLGASFADRVLPLGGIFLPERRENAALSMQPLPGSASIIELVRHSFSARLVEAMGWQPGRMSLLAEAAARAPVTRLTVPDGLHHLDDACRAIAARLREGMA